nr:MAG TPA: hypothetical protein [Caudoviricetes sp.]
MLYYESSFPLTNIIADTKSPVPSIFTTSPENR